MVPDFEDVVMKGVLVINSWKMDPDFKEVVINGMIVINSWKMAPDLGGVYYTRCDVIYLLKYFDFHSLCHGM